MKKGTGKTALLSMILIPVEIISILIGSYRVVGNIFSDWRADRLRDKQIEEGQFAVVEHDIYTGIIVPDLTGKDYNEAAKEFEELGGWLRKEGYDYSDEYPENAIISQGVMPGKEILYGSTLYVTVSLGSKPDFLKDDVRNNEGTESEVLVEVPDLRGLSEEEASKILNQKGINIGEILYGYDANANVLLNKVMNQSISAGEYLNVGDSIDIVICVGGLDDYSEQNQNSNGSTIDDDQLCQLASDYYYAHNGVRPPCVRIDGYDGDIVMIHLYEAMSDHDATWDWYYVDRNTGKTTNFMGESFNIFTE